MAKLKSGTRIYGNATVDNNLTVGSETLTGTASQPLQVTGGAYVSGNAGIGTTNPSQSLHVQGNARVTGGYYDSNNNVGTAGSVLSSTGSGTSWVQIPFAEPKNYYNYFEISTSASTYGSLIHKYIQSQDNEVLDLSETDQLSSFITSSAVSFSINSDGGLDLII